MARRRIIFEGTNQVLNSLFQKAAATIGWTATIPDPNDPGRTIPNPITQEQAVANRVMSFIGELAEAQQVQTALVGVEVTARNAARQERESVTTTTDTA